MSLGRFISHRLLHTIVTLYIAATVIFFMAHAIPGSVARLELGDSPFTGAALKSIEASLGLNTSIWQQYLTFIGRASRGSFGISFYTDQAVTTMIRTAAPSTVQLAVAALFIGVIIGLPVGIIAGLRVGRPVDRLMMSTAIFGVAIPYYWLAIMLIFLFAVRLKILPAIGTGSPKALILPAIALGWGLAGLLARVTRSGIAKVQHEPYLVAARVRGIPSTRIFTRYITRSTAAPVISVLALQVGVVISGAALVETIFSRNGLGSILVTAINDKDMPVIEGVVLLIVAVYLVVNLIADVLIRVIDPRILANEAQAQGRTARV
jgi:peptide/nickel transport system permease protein